MEVGSGLLSHGVASALPSTLVDFTAGFGMGPGVSPPLLPPTPLCLRRLSCAVGLRPACRRSSRAHGTLGTEQDKEVLLQAQDIHTG